MRMTRAHKVATNLSVRSDLVRRAKALELNLSRLLEAALEQAIREEERRRWLSENQPGIDEYNRKSERHGVFSDRWRPF